MFLNHSYRSPAMEPNPQPVGSSPSEVYQPLMARASEIADRYSAPDIKVTVLVSLLQGIRYSFQTEDWFQSVEGGVLPATELSDEDQASLTGLVSEAFQSGRGLGHGIDTEANIAEMTAIVQGCGYDPLEFKIFFSAPIYRVKGRLLPGSPLN